MEILLSKIQAATGKTREEIISFVQENILSYETVSEFSCAFGRLPQPDEITLIKTFGLRPLLSTFNNSLSKPLSV